MMLTFKEFMKIREETGLFSKGPETGNTHLDQTDPNMKFIGGSGFRKKGGMTGGIGGGMAAGGVAPRMKK